MRLLENISVFVVANLLLIASSAFAGSEVVRGEEMADEGETVTKHELMLIPFVGVEGGLYYPSVGGIDMVGDADQFNGGPIFGVTTGKTVEDIFSLYGRFTATSNNTDLSIIGVSYASGDEGGVWAIAIERFYSSIDYGETDGNIKHTSWRLRPSLNVSGRFGTAAIGLIVSHNKVEVDALVSDSQAQIYRLTGSDTSYGGGFFVEYKYIYSFSERAKLYFAISEELHGTWTLNVQNEEFDYGTINTSGRIGFQYHF